jgi:hypothetical protein
MVLLMDNKKNSVHLTRNDYVVHSCTSHCLCEIRDCVTFSHFETSFLLFLQRPSARKQFMCVLISSALIDSTVPITLSIFNASYPTVPTDTSVTEPGVDDFTCKILVNKTLE